MNETASCYWKVPRGEASNLGEPHFAEHCYVWGTSNIHPSGYRDCNRRHGLRNERRSGAGGCDDRNVKHPAAARYPPQLQGHEGASCSRQRFKRLLALSVQSGIVNLLAAGATTSVKSLH